MKKIYEIFSKRQKRLRGEVPDVYQYETIPHELRVQVIYIWKDLGGDNEEFLKAHKLYREKNYKDCVNNCLNAFESCLKVICKKRGWNYTEKDTANRLIAIVFDKGLIPQLMQSHFSALRSTLESGVPTVRNKRTGHGQGTNQIAVPEYIASYILHLTASNILLLTKADEEMK